MLFFFSKLVLRSSRPVLRLLLKPSRAAAAEDTAEVVDATFACVVQDLKDGPETALSHSLEMSIFAFDIVFLLTCLQI